VKFIYAPDNTTTRQLWIIHEQNKISVDDANRRMKQIREGTK